MVVATALYVCELVCCEVGFRLLVRVSLPRWVGRFFLSSFLSYLTVARTVTSFARPSMRSKPRHVRYALLTARAAAQAAARCCGRGGAGRRARRCNTGRRRGGGRMYIYTCIIHMYNTSTHVVCIKQGGTQYYTRAGAMGVAALGRQTAFMARAGI